MPTEFIPSLLTRKKFDGMNYDKSFYHSKEWRKVASIHKKMFPLCKCGKPTHTTDHIVPIREGGAKLDMDNLQSLCKSCNARKTAKQRRVGLKE